MEGQADTQQKRKSKADGSEISLLLITPTVVNNSVAPVAYQVILEPGIGQFREFEPHRVHTRINSLGLFLVHKLN